MDALKKQDTAEAFDIFSGLLEQEPPSAVAAVAHVGLGRVFANENEHEKALEHFQEALTLNPELAPAMAFSGQSREKLGDTEQALADYEEALQIDPSSKGRVQMRLSRLLEQEDRPDEAIKYLQDAIARAPQDASLRLLLAGLHMRSNNQDKGEHELTRAVELRPDLWIAQYQLGRSKLRNKDYAAAKVALEKAAELNSDKSLIQYALGSALSGLGEYAKAARAYGKAYAQSPRMIRAAVDAALCKAKLGKTDEALAELLELARGRRQVAVAQRAIGDIYFEMGKPEDAVEYYRATILNADDDTRPAGLQEALDATDEDANVLARKFHDALSTVAAQKSGEFKGNPKAFRAKIDARRDRVGGPT